MTHACTPLPSGSWTSPVTIDAMLASGVSLAAVEVDHDQVGWLESRPEEDGRQTLVLDGVEVTPAPAALRSRAQEYGGGVWHAQDGIVAWCNDTDGALHARIDGRPRRISPANRDLRFGGLRVDAARRQVVAVREDHRGEGEAVTTIVALSVDDENADGGRVLCQGADFYAHPEVSPFGRLAWVEWNHPDMPWDGTLLKIGQLSDDGIEAVTVIAGGHDVSAVHPKWGPDGSLYFLSDESGYWNPWVFDGPTTRSILDEPHDFCRPLWVLGNAEYAVLDERTLVMRWYADAGARVGLVDVPSGDITEIIDPVADVDAIAAGEAGIFLVAAHADRPDEIARLEVGAARLAQPALTTVRPGGEQPDPAWVSVPESIWFEGRHGRSQAFYYPPTSPDAELREGEAPITIVNTHGGPTAMAPGTFRTDFQFWTSRGIAVLDVNYSGSSGFGRDYRNRLHGNWGIADVDDCVDAVKEVAGRGLADPERVVIQGGSAGGYTTLQALVSSDVFAAGMSRYGIGDLETLVGDTHKFESRYPYKLVGPYPEAKAVYEQRSPIHHVEQLSSPMLILQGLDDKVVPPSQAESMAEAVRAKKLPVAVKMFESEGHGFRRQETRRAVVEAQLSFLSQLFDFEPADQVPVLEVENL